MIIITSIEDVRKLKKGQASEVILKDDDGDPLTYLKLEDEYEKIFAEIEKVHLQEDKEENRDDKEVTPNNPRKIETRARSRKQR